MILLVMVTRTQTYANIIIVTVVRREMKRVDGIYGPRIRGRTNHSCRSLLQFFWGPSGSSFAKKVNFPRMLHTRHARRLGDPMGIKSMLGSNCGRIMVNLHRSWHYWRDKSGISHRCLHSLIVLLLLTVAIQHCGHVKEPRIVWSSVSAKFFDWLVTMI